MLGRGDRREGILLVVLADERPVDPADLQAAAQHVEGMRLAARAPHARRVHARAAAPPRAAAGGPTPALHAGGSAAVVAVDDSRVLAWWRRHPRSGTFIGLANFGEDDAAVQLERLSAALPESARPRRLEPLIGTQPELEVHDGWARVPALGFQWLIDP